MAAYQKSFGEPNHMGGVIRMANKINQMQNVIEGKYGFIRS
jgi:hypothetical protein